MEINLPAIATHVERKLIKVRMGKVEVKWRGEEEFKRREEQGWGSLGHYITAATVAHSQGTCGLDLMLLFFVSPSYSLTFFHFLFFLFCILYN